jgi:23S rRNA (pseudouridine1915-N3)-methyltransferase
MNIRLIFLGKTRRAELRALLEDYVERIGRSCVVSVHELREPFGQGLERVKVDPAARWVLLDAGGKQLSSQQFARWLGGLRDRGTREVVFLCGDDTGFPDSIRARAQERLSLSTLTLPHELARVVLVEQIYRAFAILSGHPYAK